MILESIDYRDPAWIAIAYLFGLMFKSFRLPPMLGFLLAGFILNFMGVKSDHFLNEIADLGVTLLLFTIGLKLRIRNLLKIEIWATTTIHMASSILVIAGMIIVLSAWGVLMFNNIDIITAVVIAFALSFSSTVFAVKTFEDRGSMTSRYGQVAIGILVMQDIFAVIFLAVSSGKVPSPWALTLLLLIPGRHLLGFILKHSGHSELLAVFGFIMALGGAALFEKVGIKGDLGALILGVLLSSHTRAGELSGKLMTFKDVFLVCFFLTIGLSGLPTLYALGSASILLILIPLKVLLFFRLLTFFRMRARSSAMAALGLGNYSEFGLIVAAIAISMGLLPQEWITAIAIALTFSFIIISPLNVYANELYLKFRIRLKRYESLKRLEGDENINLGDKSVLIFGMGRVGRAAYDEMEESFKGRILGIDHDEREVQYHIEKGRQVTRGDATSPEFWSRVDNSNNHIELILLALPVHSANRQAALHLREMGYTGPIVATTKHFDQEDSLKSVGVDAVFNIYAEAGQGTANSMRSILQGTEAEDVSAES